MAINVDPFLHPIPTELRQNRETEAFFEYFVRWAHDIWRRTGGGDDAVAESQIGELYEPGIQTSNADELIEELEVSAESQVVHDLLERVEDLENLNLVSSILEMFDIEVVGITGDFTTTGTQIIICNNTTANTVSLNPNPGDGEMLHIKRRDAGVTVDGNGNNIDAALTLFIAGKNSPNLIYTLDAGEWSII